MAAARTVIGLAAPDPISRRFSAGSISSCGAVIYARSRNGYCSLSMNGSDAIRECEIPVEVHRTRSFPAVSSLADAMDQLNSAVMALKTDPPRSSSGIIRLEVPIYQQIDAISWLHAQCQLPCCFFSGRGQRSATYEPNFFNGNNGGCPKVAENMISVAGVGSAVFFQQCHPFTLEDWRCIKRFLSKDCPLIRAYGAIRFDSGTKVSFEWKGFGSFYFIIPQVEFDELEECSILATTIAWDDSLLWTCVKAIDSLQATMCQISSFVSEVPKELPRAIVLNKIHVPNKASWDVSVKKALKIINGRSTSPGLLKVVLARSSRVVTDSGIDPIALLACLQVEGRNAYQFCIQPPDSPAFIGNTPEQLFHRKHLHVSSEALAGTRARGGSRVEDLRIEHDLLLSPKDHLEFTIVRESIRRKLEIICDQVFVEPSKTVLKLPRVQHLYAQLSGTLRSEDDEFDILSSLHPSPAVCGYPTDVARRFISEIEMFDRGMYAGPVGWFGGTEAEFAVGIRSALVGKGLDALIYAGAGIVEGTNPSLEWEELELKASQFMKFTEDKEPLSCLREMDRMDVTN